MTAALGAAAKLGVAAAAAYLILIAYMYFKQRDFQYHPNTAIVAPASIGLPQVSVEEITTADGERLQAWYVQAPLNRPTILYFHGNGGGISDRPNKIGHFIKAGFGILALSYRGYEGSTGTPSEAGFIMDAEAAHAWLAAKGIAPKHIFLLGESIGSGVAVQLAAAKPVGAVALEAPYLNAVDVGAAFYWYLPVRWLMKDQFRSSDYISKVTAPLLFTHGRQDIMIPFAQGEALFAMANAAKTMNAVDGIGHDVIADPRTWAAESAFFERIAAAR
jgi:uncharacterized protein